MLNLNLNLDLRQVTVTTKGTKKQTTCLYKDLGAKRFYDHYLTLIPATGGVKLPPVMILLKIDRELFIITDPLGFPTQLSVPRLVR